MKTTAIIINESGKTAMETTTCTTPEAIATAIQRAGEISIEKRRKLFEAK